MMELAYGDEYLTTILKDVQVIAMVGASAKEERPSYSVMRYLQAQGYRVVPVNPGLAGQDILGETVYGSLADIPFDYQMVDIFRNAEAAAKISEEAVALKDDKSIAVIWMQLGICHEEAAERARGAGLKVVMDRCPKIEYGRLLGRS
ncbi:CoA-binding protein [Terasakiella sp. SH-1]|uniref:CoA-binding protein n=1 Tax=Terasakiella sp. SH-1 TaxID=2560057 RepID=UPI001F0F7F39|nr:CoA-binding protein [Terasakiella sp. SH-1]